MSCILCLKRNTGKGKCRHALLSNMDLLPSQEGSNNNITDPGGAAHQFAHLFIIIECILLLWYQEIQKLCLLSSRRLYLGAI